MPPFAAGSDRFNYRVAGVCIRDGHVLLHTEELDDFWVLPGGRPKLGETSRDALRREMTEEIATAVETGRLLWVMENFYDYRGTRCHELAFYYEMALPEDYPYRDAGSSFTGFEGEIALSFQWIPLSALETIRLLPTFLTNALLDLPETLLHIVHCDSSSRPRDVDDSTEVTPASET